LRRFLLCIIRKRVGVKRFTIVLDGKKLLYGLFARKSPN
jgi:hypothetical protein